MKVVAQRVISAVVLGAAVVAAVAAGPLWLLAAVLAVVTWLGVREMALLAVHAGLSFGVRRVLAGSGLILGGTYLGGSPGMSFALALAVIIVVIPSLRGSVKGAMGNLGIEIFSLLVPAWSLSHALLVADRPSGRGELLFLFAVIWACDTFAYVFGMLFGKHRLAPEISPKKSVEGLVAGLLSAPLVALGFSAWGGLPFGFWPAAGLALVMAALGQLGDLTESLLKRDAGVKDSGFLIPGHGGVLDRVDALLLALPAYYWLDSLLGAAR